MTAVRHSLSFIRGAALLALALSTSCSRAERQAPGSGGVSATDDWGRAVALAQPAQRIVSLAPASTELAFALGLGGRLVGRTTWCDYPAAARAVPDVGNGIGPNVEAIAAQRPDLVLLYASEANRQALERLTALGIPVAVLKLDLTDDLRRAARLVGTLAGTGATADRLVAAFDTALAAASGIAAQRERRPLRIYVDVEGNPPITVGSGSYLSEIIAAAGARTLFADITGGSGPVSLEAIAQRNPDVVLVLQSDTTRRPSVAGRPGWRTLRAVREGRVVAVDGSLYGRPSPRMPAAVRDLTARLDRLSARP